MSSPSVDIWPLSDRTSLVREVAHRRSGLFLGLRTDIASMQYSDYDKVAIIVGTESCILVLFILLFDDRSLPTVQNHPTEQRGSSVKISSCLPFVKRRG